MSNLWMNCPVCGSPDTKWEHEDEGYIVFCTNLECASNGGSNTTALEARQAAKDLERAMNEPRALVYQPTMSTMSTEQGNALCDLATVRGNLEGLRDVQSWDGVKVEDLKFPTPDFLQSMIDRLENVTTVMFPTLKESE